MRLTYLLRELSGRRRQTLIVAIGMALAVALVVVLNAAARGVENAQSKVLESVYGVGTDMTITAMPNPGEGGPGGPGGFGPQQFDFNSGDGATTDDGNTDIASSRLTLAPGTQAIESSALAQVAKTDGVIAASGILELQLMNFSGTIGAPPQDQQNGSDDGSANPPDFSQAPDRMSGQMPGGFGGGRFNIEQTTVAGVDPKSPAGPYAGLEVADGRALTSADTTSAIISTNYAAAQSVEIGDKVELGDTEFTVVGTVDSASVADIVIPLAQAQQISGKDNSLSTIYVTAADSSQVTDLQNTLAAAFPDYRVESQSDLAANVTGSLSSAAKWVSGIGLAVSIGVILLAFALAIIFTISSIQRRTRDFGTLKAIGWSSGRIAQQISLESLVQTMGGALVGLVIGILAIVGVNWAGITLDGSAGGFSMSGFGAPPGMEAPMQDDEAPAENLQMPNPGQMEGQDQMRGFPGMGGMSDSAETVTTTLHLSVNPGVVGIALGVGALGAISAAGVGALRISRLRPAVALRSVD